ncbi:MAG: hypothetical protein EOO75_19105 [Myxococcales bacterium]|nr:MAG: hypothetical protein EOO75_19105 [Myxococcales bacterium]
MTYPRLRAALCGLLMTVGASTLASCEGDPMIYRLVVVEGSLARQRATDPPSNWCPNGGTPDVVVETELTGVERSSGPADAWSPVWQDTLYTRFRDDYAAALRVTVSGYCGLGGKVTIGETTFAPDEHAFEDRPVVVPPFGGVQALVLHWKPGAGSSSSGEGARTGDVPSTGYPDGPIGDGSIGDGN